MSDAKLTRGLNVSGNFLVTAGLAGNKVSQFNGSVSLRLAGRNLSEMDTLRSNSIGGPTENERNRVV